MESRGSAIARVVRAALTDQPIMLAEHEELVAIMRRELSWDLSVRFATTTPGGTC